MLRPGLILFLMFPALIVAGLYLERLEAKHVIGYLAALALGLLLLRACRIGSSGAWFVFCVLDGVLAMHVLQDAVHRRRTP